MKYKALVEDIATKLLEANDIKVAKDLTNRRTQYTPLYRDEETNKANDPLVAPRETEIARIQQAIEKGYFEKKDGTKVPIGDRIKRELQAKLQGALGTKSDSGRAAVDALFKAR